MLCLSPIKRQPPGSRSLIKISDSLTLWLHSIERELERWASFSLILKYCKQSSLLICPLGQVHSAISFPSPSSLIPIQSNHSMQATLSLHLHPIVSPLKRCTVDDCQSNPIAFPHRPLHRWHPSPPISNLQIFKTSMVSLRRENPAAPTDVCGIRQVLKSSIDLDVCGIRGENVFHVGKKAQCSSFVTALNFCFY